MVPPLTLSLCLNAIFSWRSLPCSLTKKELCSLHILFSQPSWGAYPHDCAFLVFSDYCVSPRSREIRLALYCLEELSGTQRALKSVCARNGRNSCYARLYLKSIPVVHKQSSTPNHLCLKTRLFPLTFAARSLKSRY